MAVTQSTKKVIIFGAASDALTGKRRVGYVNWLGATTAGHVLNLTDTAGNVVLKLIAQAANDPFYIPIFETWDGIIVTTMQSGVLHVHTK